MAGILSKGAKLSASATESGTYQEIANVKTIPGLGGTKEKVDVTSLGDENFKNINGLINYGDLTFNCIFDNSGETSNYRIIRGYEETDAVVYWKVEYPDKLTSSGHGTTFSFAAQVAAATDPLEVNGAITFNAQMALQSKITVTNPD